MTKYRIRKHIIGINEYYFIEVKKWFGWNRLYKFTPIILEDYPKCNLQFTLAKEAEEYLYTYRIPNKIQTVKEIKG